MEGWSGFTDEQLQKFKGQDDGRQKPPQRRKEPRKNPATSNRNRARGKLHQRQHGLDDAENTPLDNNQMLSTPSVRKSRPTLSEGQRNTALSAGNDTGHKQVKDTQHEKNQVVGNKQRNDKEEETDDVESKEKETPVEVNELNEAEGRSRELSQLETIQKKQLEMEEENRKKKIALTRAINERKKRTQAETKQLAFIQRELGKLESLLSKDVRILREKIEASSFEYNAARRRYEKAESEFVTAKIHLHKIAEHKEALTEHLYTIIQENETRKSNKLAELIEKLNVENIDEYIAAAEKEMDGEPTSPKQPTTSSSKAQILTGSSENGENISQGTVTSMSDQSSDAGAGNSSISVAASEFNISNQCGLETITEVDSEVTDVAVNKDLTENGLSNAKSVAETDKPTSTVHKENGNQN